MNMACFQTSIANSQMENFFFFLFLWSHNQSEAIVHLTEHKAIHLLLRFNLSTVAILCANMFSLFKHFPTKIISNLLYLYDSCIKESFFQAKLCNSRLAFFKINFYIKQVKLFYAKAKPSLGMVRFRSRSFSTSCLCKLKRPNQAPCCNLTEQLNQQYSSSKIFYKFCIWRYEHQWNYC